MLEKPSQVRVFFAVFVILLVLVALTVEAGLSQVRRKNNGVPSSVAVWSMPVTVRTT